MSRVPSLSSPFLLGFDEIERALDRAWSAVMLYEVGHAARTRAMDACLRAVRAVGEERVVVRVCEQGWQHPMERGGASLAGELARVLHSLCGFCVCKRIRHHQIEEAARDIFGSHRS